jgi:hypothetical protein
MNDSMARKKLGIIMGQYYIAAFIAPNANPNDIKHEDIIAWKCPYQFNNGSKLMEHSYIKNNFMSAVENSLSPKGMFYKYRLIWAGDYADEESCGENIYTIANMSKNKIDMNNVAPFSYRYIVNHTKKLYIDKYILEGKGDFVVHPLSLLTSDGNGRGGGDYHGKGIDMCGSWALNSISMEMTFPEGYEELIHPFDIQQD